MNKTEHHRHSPLAINMSDADEVVNTAKHHSSDSQTENVDNYESSVISLTVSQVTIDTTASSMSQDSSSATDMTPDDQTSLPITVTRRNDIRATSPAMNAYSFRENQSTSNRTSPINGPGLAKHISMSSSPLSVDASGKKRIDAALEKNLETIVTQVRRTTTKPFQLTQNDLHLFDSTTPMKNVHHSREMTPDSINTDSANEDQPSTSVLNGHHYSRSMIHPSAGDYINPYGQLPWPPAAYPFAHQHPGLYLPYPPLVTPTNGLPSFYPSYDPLLIEQHYNPQGFSAYYDQQQAAATARLFPEHPSLSDNHSVVLTTPTREQPGKPSALTGEVIQSIDSVHNDNRSKKMSVNNGLQYISSSASHSRHHLTINEQFSRLSPDLSSDGDGAATNDADSILSFESHKSLTVNSMPVLEDGLSDSENHSSDEPLPSFQTKSNARHQSTQSDFHLDHHQSLSSSMSKQQSAKSITNEPESQLKSLSTRPIARPQYDDSSTITTDYDTDEETVKLLGMEHRMNAKNQAVRDAAVSKTSRSREVQTRVIADPENSSVLIEGVLFRCRYLGSTQLLAEGNPTKVSRMMQAQEVVERIKAPDGENQPSVDVDLFISTEKIMVLNTDLEDILMDHSLRSISYIADIGDLVVLMAKRRYLQHDGNEDPNSTATRRVVTFNQKLICHVFESDEAQSVAHSIGQAFQVAYVEFLKANGIDDPSFTRDIDYQEVLEQQEMGNEELDRFSRKECQKEAIVTKGKNEPLGIVIVESGWGSMLPTVVIANMMPGGPAVRGGHLNIGDQIISVNGISLVGLPLSSCQAQIKNMKHLPTVRLVVVSCPPVVEVLIRRPDTKYQLGFSVQNGIICSLLRGGIAERGGIRVGHRIIEINGQSVVATPHERIVSMLSHSIGELRMKTMPTQMYRLLTGQETPIYI